VKALGGELDVNSAPGHGTRLTFTFPLQRLQAKLRGEGAFANPAASA
jgi:hypothetical protein